MTRFVNVVIVARKKIAHRAGLTEHSHTARIPIAVSVGNLAACIVYRLGVELFGVKNEKSVCGNRRLCVIFPMVTAVNVTVISTALTRKKPFVVYLEGTEISVIVVSHIKAAHLHPYDRRIKLCPAVASYHKSAGIGGIGYKRKLLCAILRAFGNAREVYKLIDLSHGQRM